MKLFYLLKNINCRVLGNHVVDIKGLYDKDTEVKEGGLFFSLRGTKVDGKNYIDSAIKNGAVAIVTEQEIKNLSRVTQIVVKDAREVMSKIACRFYGNPADKLKIIGVTGTNGKTTTTFMLDAIAKSSGKKTAVIGTNGIYFSGMKFDVGMTTPDPIELQKYFYRMQKNKIEYVFMEVSAHAIDLKKLEGFCFQVMIFTNLTEDHLDYFKTLNHYFDVKASIFSKKHTKFAVLNSDDDYINKLIESINLPFITYSIIDKADCYAKKIKQNGTGQKFLLNDIELIELSMSGKFNVSNALGAIATMQHLGFSFDDIKSGLKIMQQVEGRFNTIMIQGILIVVDYAHTPDGLENILNTCKNMCLKHKLISVFGCGGNRDSQKRAIMGEISSKIADFSIITSDNPRFEAREKIANDIVSGIKTENYIVELDRSKAINRAFEMANVGDVIVIAGKGAEPYIDENGEKIPYSDFSEIEKIRRKIDE